jgi:hypothetical protein
VNRRSFPHEAVMAIFQVVGEGNSHSEVCDSHCDMTAPTHAETVSVVLSLLQLARLSAGFRGLCRPGGYVSRLTTESSYFVIERHRMHNNAPLFSCAPSNKSWNTAPVLPLHSSFLL